MRTDVAGPDGSALSEGLGAWKPIETAPATRVRGRVSLHLHLEGVAAGLELAAAIAAGHSVQSTPAA